MSQNVCIHTPDAVELRLGVCIHMAGSYSRYIIGFVSALLHWLVAIWPVTENIGVLRMHLSAPVKSNSSSARTLAAAQVDDKTIGCAAASFEGLVVFELTGAGLLAWEAFTCTEKSEYTGL